MKIIFKKLEKKKKFKIILKNWKKKKKYQIIIEQWDKKDPFFCKNNEENFQKNDHKNRHEI